MDPIRHDQVPAASGLVLNRSTCKLASRRHWRDASGTLHELRFWASRPSLLAES